VGNIGLKNGEVMKKIIFGVLVLTCITFANLKYSQAQGACIPSGFCSDKITVMMESLSIECFKLPTAPTSNEVKDSENYLTFNRCTQVQSELWKAGFGKTCGGAIAQTECLNNCKTTVTLSYCLESCARF
jgi:hypothetical protein